MARETGADQVARILRATEQRAPRSSIDNDGCARLVVAGRITVAFHPDRLDRRGRTAVTGLLTDGAYLNQWTTGMSSGSRSALPGGFRDSWEREVFGLPADAPAERRPVYGALDLLRHRHGGSPAFGSCFLVLRDHVRERCTLTLGDSHLLPKRVGTFSRPEAIVDGLHEQAARGQLLGQQLSTEDLHAVLHSERRAAPRRTVADYIEVQIHGGVSLADIAAIVIDPSFEGTAVERTARSAAEAANAAFEQHPGTVIEPRELRHDPDAVDWDDDPAYVDHLIASLEQAAHPSDKASAAIIGRLLPEQPAAAPAAEGDAPRSLLQQVKHLWRLTYKLGRDAQPGYEPAARHVG